MAYISDWFYLFDVIFIFPAYGKCHKQKFLGYCEVLNETGYHFTFIKFENDIL